MTRSPGRNLIGPEVAYAKGYAAAVVGHDARSARSRFTKTYTARGAHARILVDAWDAGWADGVHDEPRIGVRKDPRRIPGVSVVVSGTGPAGPSGASS